MRIFYPTDTLVSELGSTGEREERESSGGILLNNIVTEECVVHCRKCDILFKRLQWVQAVSPFVGDEVGETGCEIEISQK